MSSPGDIIHAAGFWSGSTHAPSMMQFHVEGLEDNGLEGSHVT